MILPWQYFDGTLRRIIEMTFVENYSINLEYEKTNY